MFDKFLHKQANDVYWGMDEVDCDHPICPNCGSQMTFHGGELPYGEGYWDCEECDYTFNENDLSKCRICDPYGDDEYDWYCDNCGAYLNNQEFFTAYNGSWTCTKCGFENDVTENNIIPDEVDDD